MAFWAFLKLSPDTAILLHSSGVPTHSIHSANAEPILTTHDWKPVMRLVMSLLAMILVDRG